MRTVQLAAFGTILHRMKEPGTSSRFRTLDDVETLRLLRMFDWIVYADRGDGNQRRSGMTRVRMPNVVQNP